MSKIEFLQQLRTRLAKLPPAEAEEILRDQDEYIRDAVAAGRSEDDVVDSLGDPKIFAAGVMAEASIARAANTNTGTGRASRILSAVVAVAMLAPLNLVFVLGPSLGLLALTFVGWLLATLAGLGSLIALLWFFVFGLWTANVATLVHLGTFLACCGGLGLGLVSLWSMGQLTRLFIQLTLQYLKWNLHFVRARA